MTKPITPTEARTTSINNIPSFVIKSFNKLIVANLIGKSSIVRQKDIVDEIIKAIDLAGNASSGCARDLIFKKHWLDVEDMYRQAGWKVEYDKAAYNEDYDSYFTFTAPKHLTGEIDTYCFGIKGE